MAEHEDDAARRAQQASERIAAARKRAAAGGLGQERTTGRKTGRVSGMDPNGPPDIRRAHQSKSGGIVGLLMLAGIGFVIYYAVTKDTSTHEVRRIFEPADFVGVIDLAKLDTMQDKVDAYLQPGVEPRAGEACREGYARMTQEIATEGYREVNLHTYDGGVVCLWTDGMPLPNP